MYYIRERANSDGITYVITVKVQNFEGKPREKTKTWKPNFSLTEKQLQFALKRVACAFEREIEEQYCGRQKPVATEDTQFNEFALYWLDMLEKTKTPSYWISMVIAFEHIQAFTDGYKLKDFEPLLIDELFKKIDSQRKIEYTVKGKECLQSAVEATGIKRRQFLVSCGVSAQTLKVAMRGERVCYKSASNIAKALDRHISELFDVQAKEVAYKSNYLEGMKKFIRNTLTYATRLGIIEQNYAYRQYVTTRHLDAEKVKSMTYNEAQVFMQACENEKIQRKLALMFLIMTGLRKGELCGLDWSDFDFEQGTVNIKRQYEAVATKGVILKEPKTEAGKRNVDLPQKLIDLLAEYREWYKEQKAKLGDKWGGADNLFIAKSGKRLHPTTIRNWLDDVLKKAGLPHYTVHSLRHTYITLLIDAQIPVTTVSKMVGHAKSSTTLGVYTACMWDHDQVAADSLDEYFKKCDG